MRCIARAFVLCCLLLGMGFSAQAAEPIRIGVSLGLTGKYAELADMNLKAYRLWESDVNARGGLLGRKVSLTVYDDRSDTEAAKEMYRRLIRDDKVDLVLGPYSSEITEAVLAVTEPNGYPLLASGAAADSMWQQGRKNLFGVYITSSKYAVGFLEVLVNHGFSKIAMISADDIFSKGIAAGTKEWARRFELDIAFYEEFRKGTKDLAQVTKRAQASGAEVLIVCGHVDESVNARLALKQIAWTPRAYYATVGPAVQQYRDILKSDADYVFTSSQWEPTSTFPGAREFAAAFAKRYQRMPSYHAASAYAAGQILEAAVRKNGSIDREKLREALYALDTITIMGRYGVDKTGKQIRHFTTTVQWQNGRKETIAPKELMTAEPIWK